LLQLDVMKKAAGSLVGLVDHAPTANAINWFIYVVAKHQAYVSPAEGMVEPPFEWRGSELTERDMKIQRPSVLFPHQQSLPFY
jgi:hypothetical protein